jgi:hypothetical protein
MKNGRDEFVCNEMHYLWWFQNISVSSRKTANIFVITKIE